MTTEEMPTRKQFETEIPIGLLTQAEVKLVGSRSRRSRP